LVGLLKSGGFIKYSFNLRKGSLHSSLQVNAFLKILKKGRHLLVDREMNRFKAVILPVSCCSCLIVLGGCISRTSFIFSGLAYMPLYDTMNPNNFPYETPEAHLVVFNFILYCVSVLDLLHSRLLLRFSLTYHRCKLLHFSLSDLGTFCLLTFDMWL